QKLECGDLRVRMNRKLPEIRQRLQTQTGLKHDLDLRGLYVDTAIIHIRTERGSSRFVVDGLRLEGIVDAPTESRIVPVEHSENEPDPEAVFKGGQLYVRGQRFFPRMVPYRGEQTGDLARMRFNITWVPDYRDVRLLAELERLGLRAMAVPP